MKVMQEMQDLPVQRRMMLSLRGIVAFEAASRTQSFAKAAQELSLSQSAVSRQIAQLEDLVGVELFARVKQRVVLTPAGDFFAERVRDIMRRLRSAANETAAFRDGGGLLRLGVLPTFGARWLIPRISGFLSANPGVTLHFNTRLPGVFEFDSSGLDATIHFGEPLFPGASLHLLFKDEVAVYMSPQMRDALDVREPQDVLRATRIGHQSRASSWSDWLRAQGLNQKAVSPALEFEQFTMVIQAATAGLGAAIIPTYMVRAEVEAGSLVQMFSSLVTETRGDYLAYPLSRESYPPLVAFRDWLLETIRSEQGLATRP
jgi:LysR family glycine cleavage system transcriptional activator